MAAMMVFVVIGHWKSPSRTQPLFFQICVLDKYTMNNSKALANHITKTNQAITVGNANQHLRHRFQLMTLYKSNGKYQ